MGIKGFFYGLLNNQNSNKFISSTPIFDSKYLLLDYNSIVHNTSAKIQNKLISLYMCKLIFDKIGLFDIKVINLIDEYLLKYFEIEETKEAIDIFFEKILEDESEKEYLDKIIIKYSCDYIKYLKEIYPSCKEIYVAIDGVPYMAKVIEQKKRRFIGELMAKITKKFIEDETNYKVYNGLFDGIEEKMYFDLRQFEIKCLKLKFSKGKITPGTIFMENLQKEISKIDGVVLDGFENPGEGERKIVEKMNMYINDDDYDINTKITVFSPDADVIILMCLENIKYDIYIHRYENDNEYKIVSVRKFCDFLIKTFFYEGEMLATELVGAEEILILNDILMLFCILGNDFIPDVLISSSRALFKINPNTDLNTIVIKYYEELVKNGTYLLNYDSDGYYESVNWNFCANLLKNINESISATKRFRLSTPDIPILPVKRSFIKEEDPLYLRLTEYLNYTYSSYEFIDISDDNYNPLIKFVEDLEKVGQYNADHLKIEYNRLLKESHMTEDQICEKYVIGIDWVCKYYLNYDAKHKEWFYDTIFPPTLFNLSRYIERNIVNLNEKINKKLSHFETNTIMSPYHHLQYVSYKDIEPLIDESKLTSADRTNILKSKKNVNWDKICEEDMSNVLICHFSKYLSQCHIKNEDQYEKKLPMPVIRAVPSEPIYERRLYEPSRADFSHELDIKLPLPILRGTDKEKMTNLSTEAKEFVPRFKEAIQERKIEQRLPLPIFDSY